MTLILAAKCEDGPLMAADSQGTESAGGGIAMKTPTVKIHKLTDQIIWGGSGSIGVIQDADVALGRMVASQDAYTLNSQPYDTIKWTLRNAVAVPMNNAYQSYIQVPGMPYNPPLTTFLFCGVTGSPAEPWILEVSVNGTAERYDGMFPRNRQWWRYGPPRACNAAALQSERAATRCWARGHIPSYGCRDQFYGNCRPSNPDVGSAWGDV